MTNIKNVNQRDLIAISMMVLISFFIESTLGLLLIPIISIPLVGGLLSSFFDAIIIFLGIYLVPRRYSALLFGILLLTLSTITPSFGPPGIYKIGIGLGLGIIIELLLAILGRSKWAYVIATAVAFGSSIPMTYWAWELKGIPTDKLEPYIFYFIIAYTILGAIGALAGAWMYEARLKKYRIIKNLREA